MKILFSPSEMKSELGSDTRICERNFIFADLYEKRLQMLCAYADFVDKASEAELCKLFGPKKWDATLRENIFDKGCAKALLRYTGTAYHALGYASLSPGAQEFAERNTIIFSNLFGPVLGGDALPNYKLKQGEKFGGIDAAKFYRDSFSAALDRYLADECVVDLRAGFYEKFYEMKREYLSFSFIKGGKVLSHYAKAWRGKVLREIALAGACSEAEVLALRLGGASVLEIKQIGLKKEIVLEIS